MRENPGPLLGAFTGNYTQWCRNSHILFVVCRVPSGKEVSVIKYFWSYQSDLPAGVGIPNFSVIHFCWLTMSFILILVTVLIYKRQKTLVRQRIQKTLVILIAFLDVSRWVWAACIGHYSIVEMLPLHLCSLSVWLEMAAVFTGKPMLKEFGYALGMPGALFSILTPDWGAYPFLSYQYLQASLGHTLLVMVPIIWVWGDGFRPDFRRLPKLFGALVMFAIPVALIDLLLGSNYLFLCEAPKDTPLELFENWFGNPGYLFPVIILILIVWLILYLPWIIKARLHKPDEPGNA